MLKRFLGGLLLVLLSSPVQAQWRAITKIAVRSDSMEIFLHCLGVVFIFYGWKLVVFQKWGTKEWVASAASMTICTFVHGLVYDNCFP